MQKQWYRLVSPIILPSANQLSVKYIDVFSLGIYDSFKHKREVRRFLRSLSAY